MKLVEHTESRLTKNLISSILWYSVLTTLGAGISFENVLENYVYTGRGSSYSSYYYNTTLSQFSSVLYNAPAAPTLTDFSGFATLLKTGCTVNIQGHV